MATKTVSIGRDERYPDYDVYDGIWSKLDTVIDMDTKTFNKYRKIQEAYNQMQEELEKLYENNKKANS